MRIAIVNWTRRRVGGAEVYLERLIPQLVVRGHSVALMHEVDEPADRPPLNLPDDVFVWCCADGGSIAIEALERWQPDVVFTHVLQDRELEATLLSGFPAVFFAHAYYGVCVSGSKAHSFPSVRPCERPFGPACLAHYLPRRCGGVSPTTMVRRYRSESRKLELLRQYDSVVTHTAHMRSVYIANGLAPDVVRVVPFYVRPGEQVERSLGEEGEVVVLFAGRMDRLKGAHVLLEALVPLRALLGRPVAAVLAGDGPERAALEATARRLARSADGVRVELTGWVDADRLESLCAEAHVLAVPSLWPEPLGQIGIEAGSTGLPSAAFDVGGISDWLHDGETGHLAELSAGAGGLASAIASCVRTPEHYGHLGRASAASARRYAVDRHLDALLPVLEAATVASSTSGTASHTRR